VPIQILSDQSRNLRWGLANYKDENYSVDLKKEIEDLRENLNKDWSDRQKPFIRDSLICNFTCHLDKAAIQMQN
jgi:hypothetical protein